MLLLNRIIINSNVLCCLLKNLCMSNISQNEFKQFIHNVFLNVGLTESNSSDNFRETLIVVKCETCFLDDDKQYVCNCFADNLASHITTSDNN